MALETDFTLPAFESYATVAELDSHAASLGVTREASVAKFTSLTVAQKEAYAKDATLWIQQFLFVGDLASEVLSPVAMWPRSGLCYPNGIEIDSTVIPDFVKRTEFLRILDVLDGVAVGSSFVASAGIKREKIATLETEFFGSSIVSLDSATRETEAYRSISDYIIRSSGLVRA